MHFQNSKYDLRAGRREVKFRIISLLLFLLLPASSFCAAETLTLPLVLDYPLIRSLLMREVYRDPGHKAVALDHSDGCERIELWDPEVGPEGALVKTRSRVRIKAGIPILGRCWKASEWEGYVEVLQRIRLDGESWKIRFETIDSRLYDQNGKKISLAGRFLPLIKTYLYPYLDAVVIDLAPAKDELVDFLPLVFPADERPRVQGWIDSLRPGEVEVGEDAVRINALMDAEIRPPQPRRPERPLKKQEIEDLTRLWESWDVFLVREIESLMGQPITRDERKSLLELLLSTRSQFAEALREKNLQQDLVRKQFIFAWKNLSPILRKYLVRTPSPSLIHTLAFFTASDALVVLDKLGPVFNIEISRDGLLRLAGILLERGGNVSLEYSGSLNTRLREFLGLGPPLDETGPALHSEELDFSPGKGAAERHSRVDSLRRFLTPAAHAGAAASGDPQELKQWIPPDNNTAAYLARVKTILEEAAGETFRKTQLESEYQALYRNLILATAWQESCWRQFVKSKGKIRYLISYNQSSVGLMQINQRVWRGFYRLESLRWNIRYNIRAGCEILDLYLREYAVKRAPSHESLDRDTLVQVTYSMYNAGPGEYFEFFKRSKKKAPNRRDRHFWQKYRSTQKDEFKGLLHCLTGGE